MFKFSLYSVLICQLFYYLFLFPKGQRKVIFLLIYSQKAYIPNAFPVSYIFLSGISFNCKFL